MEQLRRDEVKLELEEGAENWSVVPAVRLFTKLTLFFRIEHYNQVVDHLWDKLRVMVPLETRYTHLLYLPFYIISLMPDIK